jgi:hypothetical protein
VSRHRPAGGYAHRWHRIARDHYRLSWSYDRYYPGSRLRHPQAMTRDTDYAGAVRFARKWEIAPPDPDQGDAK